MINNIQLEVMRKRKQLEMIRLLDSPYNTIAESEGDDLLDSVSVVGEQVGSVESHNFLKAPHTKSKRVAGSEDKDTSLILEDTEHPDLKVGTQKNGRKYSVRTNRKRFFFPDEWNLFSKNLDNPNQERCYDILINTGARYNEAKNIKKEDIDFERGTLTIKVAKIKARKGQKFPDPRTFKLSSQFLDNLKKYTKDLKDDDTIPFLTNSALNLAVKKITKRLGFKDPYMFAVHNFRKTHGQYLVAMDVNIANICKRLGHDHNTFLGSYCSADIFNDKDREGIAEILGDLIPKKKVPFTGGLINGK